MEEEQEEEEEQEQQPQQQQMMIGARAFGVLQLTSVHLAGPNMHQLQRLVANCPPRVHTSSQRGGPIKR